MMFLAGEAFWNDAMTDAVLRWGHVISGICWIGLLYFFNFVNVPYQGKVPAEMKKVVNPELLPRALWWFRWAAMSTFIFGLILFFWVYMHGKQIYGVETLNAATGKMEKHITGRALYIMIGMTLAVIMWFNVWFIIWPKQRAIIRGVKSGTPAPANYPKVALMASRFNAYSSGPMLMLMLFGAHAPGAFNIGHLALAFVLGLGCIFLCIKASANTGSSI